MSADPRRVASPSGTGGARPWVVRLGSYLHIFGVPLDGLTLCWMEDRAKEREAHGV